MQAQAMANMLKALSTTRRIQIVKFLLESKEPTPSTMISAHLGIGEGPTSYNLSKLAEVGLVIRQPSGRWTLWTINRNVMKELVVFWRTKPRSNPTPAEKVDDE